MSEQVTQNYVGLKVAVIGMGVLLVVGTVALVIGLVRQAERIDQVFDAEIAGWETALPAPLAGRVVQMTQDGNRLSLLVERDGRRRVVVIDITNGKVTGTLNIPVLEPVP